MNFHTFPQRRALVVALCLGLLVVALGALTASAAPFPAPYMNGFENATDAMAFPVPVTPDPNTMYGATRVASGTGGVTSAVGNFHATVPTTPAGGALFTQLGGYSSTFPSGGYTVSIDIYLDTAVSGISEDKRMAWTVASSGTDALHLRDFVFSIGTNGTGGYVMSASNNAPGWPADVPPPACPSSSTSTTTTPTTSTTTSTPPCDDHWSFSTALSSNELREEIRYFVRHNVIKV